MPCEDVQGRGRSAVAPHRDGHPVPVHGHGPQRGLQDPHDPREVDRRSGTCRRLRVLELFHRRQAQQLQVRLVGPVPAFRITEQMGPKPQFRIPRPHHHPPVPPLQRRRQPLPVGRRLGRRQRPHQHPRPVGGPFVAVERGRSPRLARLPDNHRLSRNRDHGSEVVLGRRGRRDRRQRSDGEQHRRGEPRGLGGGLEVPAAVTLHLEHRILRGVG